MKVLLYYPVIADLLEKSRITDPELDRRGFPVPPVPGERLGDSLSFEFPDHVGQGRDHVCRLLPASIVIEDLSLIHI